MNSISNQNYGKVSSTEKIFIRKLDNKYHDKDITISKIARSILDTFTLLFTSNKKIKIAKAEVSGKYQSLATLQKKYKSIDPIQELKRGITKDGINQLQAHHQVVEKNTTATTSENTTARQPESIVIEYLAHKLHGKPFEDLNEEEQVSVVRQSIGQSVENAHTQSINITLISKIPNWQPLNDNEKFLLLKMNQAYQNNNETDFSSTPLKEKIAENEQLLLTAMKHISPKAFLLASKSLKNNSKFLLKAIKANAAVLNYMGDNRTKNDGFLLTAIKENAEAFKFADPTLQNDAEFRKVAKQNNPDVAKYL